MSKYSKNHEWDDTNFEVMEWHDSVIHAFKVLNPSDKYDFSLQLELDYVLERQTEKIAPAILIFYNIDKLKIDVELDYKESMIVDCIEKVETTTKSKTKTDFPNYRWIIKIQSYSMRNNRIEFYASNFKQRISGEPFVRQYLKLEE